MLAVYSAAPILAKPSLPTPSPQKKTVQGVIGAIILPMVISLFFWTIQYHTEFDFFINMDI